MSELRKRLEAKQRRRESIPVQVDNIPDGAEEAVDAAQTNLRMLVLSGKPDDDPLVLAAHKALDQARAAIAACFVRVEFQTIDEADMEALAAAATTEDGSLDTKAITAPLAAACAVDEDLRDEDWWAAQIPMWSHGERVSFGTRLVELNYSAPGARVPKG